MEWWAGAKEPANGCGTMVLPLGLKGPGEETLLLNPA